MKALIFLLLIWMFVSIPIEARLQIEIKDAAKNCSDCSSSSTTKEDAGKQLEVATSAIKEETSDVNQQFQQVESIRSSSSPPSASFDVLMEPESSPESPPSTPPESSSEPPADDPTLPPPEQPTAQAATPEVEEIPEEPNPDVQDVAEEEPEAAVAGGEGEAAEVAEEEPETAVAGGEGEVAEGGEAGGGEEGDGFGITEDQFMDAVSGNGFPTPTKEQYQAFISGLGNSGITTKREAAMFLANILQESDGLQAKEEYACQESGCPDQYGGMENGKSYHGRGYIQLTWKDNYAAASTDLYGDDRLVQDPDAVASDEQVAWDTASWYWKTRVHVEPAVVEGQFGASIKAINGALECTGPNEKAEKRKEFYKNILTSFAITEQPNLDGCF